MNSIGQRTTRRVPRGSAAITIQILLALALASSAQANSPIANMLEREGYSCDELRRAELQSVERSGALYRVRCDDNARYAMLIRPDGTTTVVAEGAARRTRRY